MHENEVPASCHWQQEQGCQSEMNALKGYNTTKWEMGSQSFLWDECGADRNHLSLCSTHHMYGTRQEHQRAYTVESVRVPRIEVQSRST